MAVKTKTESQQRPQGVINVKSGSGFPQEFLTAGKDYADTTGRCTIRDEIQRVNVVKYKAQLQIFSMEDEINDLTDYLNFGSAVGGFNKSLAVMAHTGIYVPEGAGIRISKENQKALMEMQKQRNGNKKPVTADSGAEEAK